MPPVETGSPQPGAAVQSNAARLRVALALHRQGELNQAQAMYNEILQSQPQHFDALQLLATIAVQQKNPAAAVELFDRALKLNPRHAGSFNNRGIALVELKRFDEALESYDCALRVNPDYAEALNNRGVALQNANHGEESLESFDRALMIRPDYAEAHNNRGNALCGLKRSQEALESCDCALTLRPDYAEAHNNRGNALLGLKRLDEALKSYSQALGIKPDYAAAFNNRGSALLELKRFDEALQSLDCALGIKPDYAEALNTRGTALRSLRRLDQALDSYDSALRLRPDYAKAHINRGNALVDLKRLSEALESFDRALRVCPDCADAHWHEGLCRLLMGDFALGWPKNEWRWKKQPAVKHPENFRQPLWLGKEKLENKTILLHSEQGLGDTIQFCRYAAQVAQLGAKVILEVQPPLKSLLKDLAGVATVLSDGESLPYFDYQCPLLSLPLAFNTDMSSIANGSYIKSDRQKVSTWAAKLGETSKKRIGLAWSGNPANQNDHNRSIALQEFKTLVNDQAEYYCLQKELGSADKSILEQTRNLKFVGDELSDFSDTAALVELMDWVITVDTSVAHLAGAMGKEVWILLPFTPDWRWLLGRSDSPWYQSVKLFRQPVGGDWKSVLAEVNNLANVYLAGSCR